MKKIIIFIAVLFVAVIAAAIGYFSNMGGGANGNGRLLNQVPADAVFLISFKNDPSFYSIFNDYLPFRAIAGESTLHDLNYLRNRFLKQAAYKTYATGQDLYLSFHPADTGIRFLMYLPVNKSLNETEAKNLLGASLSPKQAMMETNADGPYFVVRLAELHKTLYAAFKNNSILASFSKPLLLEALRKNAEHLSKDAIAEITEANLTNNNSALRLYVINDRLFSFISNFQNGKAEGIPKLFENLNGTSIMDLNFKREALMFSGTSHLDTGGTGYLPLFQSQQPVAQLLKRVIPENTASYALFGISDYPAFHSQLKNLLQKRKQLVRINEQLNLIKASTGLVLDDEMPSKWGKEFGNVTLNTGEKIGLIGIRDSVSFMEMAGKISSPAGGELQRLNHSNLLYYAFGDPMMEFRRPYFMLVNNWLVCANQSSTLFKFAEAYKGSRYLSQIPAYANLDQLQGNQANISLYLDNESFGKRISSAIKPAFSTAYTDTVNFGYTQMEAFAIQFSGNQHNFVSNLYVPFKKAPDKRKEPVWTFALQGNLESQPAVLSASDTADMILAQDESHILHAIDLHGKELWNAQLPGTILGHLYQFDDRSVVLTTAEKLYRFMPNGEPVPGFPLTLPKKASSGVSIYSTDHRDARIYLAAGNRILAYNRDGKVLPGWENKTLNGEVIFDLKTGFLSDVNYVVAATAKGQFYLFNYNGSLVSLLEDHDNQAFNNPFGLVISPGSAATSKIVTTDSTGSLRQFYFDKEQDSKKWGDWSADHYFDMSNLAGDSLQELVFLDRRQLYVYSASDSSLVYSYSFNQDIHHRPAFFPGANGHYVTGIASETDHELYVLDEDGSVMDGLPIEGLPDFYYGYIQQEGPYLLCGRDDGKLYLFKP